MPGTVTLYIGGLYEEQVTNQPNPPYTAYYSFGGKLVGMRRANYQAGNGQYRIVGDHLGSTTLVVDTQTPPNVVQRQYSKPYGESAWQYTAQSTGGKSLTSIGYTGQRTDEDSTGLMFYNARMYDPALSAFVSADTIAPNDAETKTRNRYSYVGYNPLGYSDLSGHCEDKPTDHGDDRRTCTDAKNGLAHYGISVANMNDWELDDLLALIGAIEDLMRAAHWDVDDFKTAMGIDTGMVSLEKADLNPVIAPGTGSPQVTRPQGRDQIGGTVTLGATRRDGKVLRLDLNEMRSLKGSGSVGYYNLLKLTFVHELAHVWDFSHGGVQTRGMAAAVGGSRDKEAPTKGGVGSYGPGWNDEEDWAESVAALVYPDAKEVTDENVLHFRKDFGSSRRASYVRCQFNVSGCNSNR